MLKKSPGLAPFAAGGMGGQPPPPAFGGFGAPPIAGGMGGQSGGFGAPPIAGGMGGPPFPPSFPHALHQGGSPQGGMSGPPMHTTGADCAAMANKLRSELWQFGGHD
jgi:hypothetical protein